MMMKPALRRLMTETTAMTMSGAKAEAKSGKAKGDQSTPPAGRRPTSSLARVAMLGVAGGALALAAIGTTVFAPQASAQLSRNGGPISVEGDSLEIFQSERRAVYAGNVDAIQGDARLRANRMTVYFRPSGASAGRDVAANLGDAERMLAEGNVYYITPLEQARGDRGVYDVDADTITLTGDVIVQREQNIIRGCELVVKLSAGRSTMKSCGADRSKPGGRVRSVFVPENQAPAKK
jgi:lipopolysaccharide export system protein LptA